MKENKENDNFLEEKERNSSKKIEKRERERERERERASQRRLNILMMCIELQKS